MAGWSIRRQAHRRGGTISPILANIYLHYALDLWFEHKIRPAEAGQATMVRYADDFVTAFESKSGADHYLEALRTRLGKFRLELAEEKTRLIRFSRHKLEENGRFSFLGFQYHREKTRQGAVKVQRRTDPKKMQGSLRRMREWIKTHRHQPLDRFFMKLKPKLQGHWNYYGVPGNFMALLKFWRQVEWTVHKWLNRRSQRRSYTWSKFYKVMKKHGMVGPTTTGAGRAAHQEAMRQAPVGRSPRVHEETAGEARATEAEGEVDLFGPHYRREGS
jgi:hypothetical protein